ncbi:MAG TPA: BON domain-containing protein [Chloroflexota bacterium]|nr:BON domain-containing protein [Chloroflexota bacterium]
MANPNDRPRTSGAQRRRVSTSEQSASAQPGLARRVQRAVEADPRFTGMNPRIVDRNGGVGLEGWVADLRARKLLGRVAEEIVGSDQVENSLLVGPPNQRPDEEIRHAVDDFMMEDRYLNPTTIHATVHDGVVHLTGSVDTTLRWRFAGALCWWIRGVRGVHNDLRAIHPEPASDDLLVAAVQLMFDKDPLVDVTEVEAIARNGVVSLSGTVAGRDAKDAAESDAWALDGVRDVVNQIEVVEIPGAPPIEGLGD